MDNPVEPAGSGPYDPSLGERVSRLEGEVQDLKSAVARVEQIVTRIEATMPHLATKGEWADVRAEMRGDLADFRSEMRADFADSRSEARAEFAEFRSETRAEFADFRSGMQAEFAAFRSAMKAEFAAFRADMMGQLAEKPSRTYMWGILGVLLTAYACGLAALAVLK